MNYCKDRKLDSTKQDIQPVTIDLTKQEVAMTIEALPAAASPKEASFDKLLSHDDVQIQNLAQMSTTQDQEQPTRAGAAKRHRSGSLPSLSDSVWSQESLKLDESFTSLGKHKHSVSFGALPAPEEGIDDLEESFNLAVFRRWILAALRFLKTRSQVKIS